MSQEGRAGRGEARSRDSLVQGAAGDGVGHVRDVDEDVVEWRYDERIVVQERALVEVEADGAGVDDGHPRPVRPRLVYHDGAQRLRQQVVDAPGAVELDARHAPELRRATQPRREVELLPEVVDLRRRLRPRRDVERARVRRVVGLRPGRVVLERQPVPVQVTPGVPPRRRRGGAVGGRAARAGDDVRRRRVGGAGPAAVVRGEAGHGEPAQGLAVAAALEGGGGLVVDLEVADVAVPAEDLDRRGRVRGADRVVHEAEGAGGRLPQHGVVPDEQEEVDGAGGRRDDGLEPGLVDHRGRRDDLGDVRVALEVEEDAEGEDAEAVVGGEVPVLVP